ncbi:Cu(I)/Ag(I) efflux system membrane fusion protein [Duganella sp. 1224]|uniref:efflux RND transporter periplasmic adaptor subunit n=1 Tax=Duganella sp. 1224 TaxID=2587052 RepID=UPI001832C411|nr:efflux RND transporter periplasmic adaptor subunit [Duganella sp. 1224]NYE61290.1 Cu(I)/Ag(I) efflux system membrane fusion protein [Duganella sp. 1224]
MMNKKKLAAAMAVALVLAGVGAGGYWLGRRGAASAPTAANAANAATAADAGAKASGTAAGGKKVLYWHDPMVPGPRFDKPGKSPFMDMQLVPVYAGDGGDGGVSISPGVQQNLGIRFATVLETTLSPALEVVGNLAWNEREVSVVQARAPGYVDKLYVRAPLDPVRKGQPLADVVLPEWVAAQEEYLTARQLSADLAEAALQRLRLAGMPDELIAQLRAGGKPQTRVTLRAPQSGVVAELSAREGMAVAAGAPLFRIQGLERIWLNAEIPETAAQQVRPGMTVEASAAALPGARFSGTIAAVLPSVDAGTRTLQARIELHNPQGQLVPGMFANARILAAPGRPVLAVASEAVIRTGERKLVFIAGADGSFLPSEVQTGVEAGGLTEIRQGLQAGQRVVASGQFLVDSEASLKGAIGRLGADQ